MNICLVSQEYPPLAGGGIGTQTFLKAHGLSARGHTVHVVSSAKEGKAQTYQDRLVTVHRITDPPLPTPGFEPSSWWLGHSAAVSAKLMELGKSVKFDLFQFPEYGAEGFVYQTDNFAQHEAKFVVQLHGPLAMFVHLMGWPEKGSTFDQIGCFMERMVVHHADRIMASSHATAAFCGRHYDAPVDQIRVIHSAVNTAVFTPQPRPSGDGFPRVLFVGSFSGNKGTNAVLRAVLALRQRYPDIRMRAIGRGDAPFVKNLGKMISEAGAAANVEIKGFVPYEQLPAEYAWCDIFAGPSVYEPGPGNVYLEAMSCGRPVIACNSGGAPEVVHHDQTGLLVTPTHQPGSDLALSEAIVRLTEDAALRQRLSGQARAWIEANCSFEKYTDKVETIYRELLA